MNRVEQLGIDSLAASHRPKDSPSREPNGILCLVRAERLESIKQHRRTTRLELNRTHELAPNGVTTIRICTRGLVGSIVMLDGFSIATFKVRALTSSNVSAYE